MDVGVIIAAILATAALIGGMSYDRRRRRERGALAAAVHGTYDAWRSEIHLVREGLTITVAFRRARSGSWTDVTALGVHPIGLSLALGSPHRLLDKLADALGRHEVETGDAAFDRAYRITSNDADLARAWLNAGLRRRIAAVANYGFRLADGTLTARRDGHLRNPHELKALLDAMTTLAGRGRALMIEWRKLAGALGAEPLPDRPLWEPGPVTRFEVGEGPGRVRVEVVRTALPALVRSLHCTSTRVVRERPSSDEEFTIAAADAPAESPPAIDEASLEPLDLPALGERYRVRTRKAELTTARLGPEVCARLSALAPRRVTGGSSALWIDLPGLELSPERVREAMALADALAAPVVEPVSVGPYR
ncbi:MAG TPA: hypothetical protein VKN99_28490 [Polyangia bacterium]|nr:hypothetical protein [Polyangia bacterium]